MAGMFNRFFLGDRTEVQKRSESNPTPLVTDPSQAPTIPNRATSPRSVSTGDALGHSAIYRAVSIIATTAKQLSLDVFWNGKQVDAPSFIKRPDIGTTRSAFIEQTIVSMALSGNAYWKITRDAQSRVTNLEVLNPLDVVPEATAIGTVTAYQYRGDKYSPNDIQHLKLLRVPGNVKDLGPIQAAQVELRGTLDTRDYGNTWFDVAGVPSGYLSTDIAVSAEDAAKLKEAWNASVRGGETAVLTQGLTYNSVLLSPKDAQFIESQNYNVTSIARLFGIPLRMLLATVEGSSMTYANMQDERKQFIEFSLMQYLVEIEDNLSQLLPGSRVAKFNIEALLRVDTSTRYASYQTAIAAGFLTIAEVRSIEGFEPLPAQGEGATNVKESSNGDETV